MTAAEVLADTDALTGVLLYHVVDGMALTTAQFTALAEIPTMQGGVLRPLAVGGGIDLNSAATVVQGNIPFSNGLLHVMNAVLIPPAE